MQFAFRVDASLEIGTGHVMRCLTLADKLKEYGGKCMFICRSHDGHLQEVISQRGFRAIGLPVRTEDAALPMQSSVHAHWLGAAWIRDAAETRQALGGVTVDWLVVDHYALDIRWERDVRSACRNLLVVDDLADRQHDCDLLLDQNLGSSESKYRDLLTTEARMLVGPQYALLRPEFAQLRSESLARRRTPQLKRLLITLGGVDKSNSTGHVLRALTPSVVPPDLLITVVMGRDAPYLQDVKTQAAKIHCQTEVIVGSNNMAQLMVDSDLAIGAGGGTAWERCCLGLPCISMVLAENQNLVAAALHEIGAAIRVDSVEEIQELFYGLFTLGKAPTFLSVVSASASRVTDGMGATLVARQLVNKHVL